MAKDIAVFDNTAFANGKGKGTVTVLFDDPMMIDFEIDAASIDEGYEDAFNDAIVFEFEIDAAKALAAIGEEYEGELDDVINELMAA